MQRIGMLSVSGAVLAGSLGMTASVAQAEPAQPDFGPSPQPDQSVGTSPAGNGTVVSAAKAANRSPAQQVLNQAQRQQGAKARQTPPSSAPAGLPLCVNAPASVPNCFGYEPGTDRWYNIRVPQGDSGPGPDIAPPGGISRPPDQPGFADLPWKEGFINLSEAFVDGFVDGSGIGRLLGGRIPDRNPVPGKKGNSFKAEGGLIGGLVGGLAGAHKRALEDTDGYTRPFDPNDSGYLKKKPEDRWGGLSGDSLDSIRKGAEELGTKLEEAVREAEQAPPPDAPPPDVPAPDAPPPADDAEDVQPSPDGPPAAPPAAGPSAPAPPPGPSPAPPPVAPVAAPPAPMLAPPPVAPPPSPVKPAKPLEIQPLSQADIPKVPSVASAPLKKAEIPYVPPLAPRPSYRPLGVKPEFQQPNGGTSVEVTAYPAPPPPPPPPPNLSMLP